MGSLQSELTPYIDSRADRPRIYADANVPAGLVAYMRERLHWDVLFVLEHGDLRRARDGEHYRLARELRRTLVTLDRDYVDDRRFPPAESGGVIVVAAPDEQGLARLLRRIDGVIFRAGRRARENGDGSAAPPLVGRKLEAHPGWPGSSRR